MKKHYSDPEVEVIRITRNDVICASNSLCAVGGNNETIDQDIFN